MAKVKEEKPPRNTLLKKGSWGLDFYQNWQIYLMFIPVIIYEIVLHYLPMFGIVMAFEDYSVAKGYFHSPWVGFGNFVELFTGEQFPIALRNTIIIAILKGTIGFIAPAAFAALRTVSSFTFASLKFSGMNVPSETTTTAGFVCFKLSLNDEISPIVPLPSILAVNTSLFILSGSAESLNLK